MSIIRRSSIFDPFALDIWHPFEGLASSFFESALSAPQSSYAADVSVFANIRIDWKETPEAHVFKADLPGLRREEVKVEVEDGRVLKISGDRKREDEQKDDRWHRFERSSGKFLRCFRLPDNSKPDLVSASMLNGVLTVMVPKEELKNSEVKPIQISGDGN